VAAGSARSHCPWQKQQIFLVSVHVDVQLSLLLGEGLDEVHMVTKRRTGAVRRQTNFAELACTLFSSSPTSRVNVSPVALSPMTRFFFILIPDY
jgi:hypothetical protein